MLEFLVTSRARRRMLRVLWADREQGSITRLAARAGIGFASAWRELRAMQAHDLVVASARDDPQVYRANLAHPLAGTMRALLAPARPVEGAGVRRIRRQLKALGAPLLEDGQEPPREAEQAIVRGVHLAHGDPAVARVLPLCLFRGRDTLRPERLRRHARRLGEKRALGFFLEVTAALSGDRRFVAWARPLHDRRCTAPRPFFHGSSRSRLAARIASRRTPAIARRWGLRMNMGMDAFRSSFERFTALR